MESYLSQIISLAKQNNRIILGIDGLSRSGKTTFVEKLSDVLDDEKVSYTIFHIDDHIVERQYRYHTGFEEWYEYFDLQWDVTWLRDHFFAKLKACHSISLPFYDNKTDSQEQRKVILPNQGLIIIEGVFLQRDEWRRYFDNVVYLDCPREKRFLRESQDTQQNRLRFEKRYWIAEEHYIQTCAPLQRADYVIKT